jgi:hypothetical protein
MMSRDTVWHVLIVVPAILICPGLQKTVSPILDDKALIRGSARERHG